MAKINLLEFSVVDAFAGQVNETKKKRVDQSSFSIPHSNQQAILGRHTGEKN